MVLVEDGGAALELDRFDRLAAGEACDSPRVVELHAVVQRLVDLPVVGGHLAARLEADHVYLGGAEPARAARRVDRDVAAADHDDGLAGEVRRCAELDVAQERERARDAGEVLAGNAQASRGRRAGRDQDGVVAVALERVEIVDPRARRDLDAGIGDVRDIALDHLGRQPVRGDREPKRAAGHGRCFEDLHAVALARQQPRGGEARRA